MGLPIGVLSYDDLRSVASEFASQRNPSGLIPVPIEKIIEFDFGINISPEMSLQSLCDVDAFINAKCTTIHVDAEVYLSANDSRYRFSIAHELAHVLLHQEILHQLKFKTMGEWKQIYLGIPERDRSWLEWQAYALAGLMLVPPAALATEYRDAVKRHLGDNPDLRQTDANRHLLHTVLGQKFRVSRPVIDKRAEKDRLDF
jgi:Zn-dependent peptidase ImmA (M78 family)